MEREVAAALESVFPRVGLRAFMNLTDAEKTTQLSELCSIVLGIRLFNQHLDKGGVGLPHIKRDMGVKAAENTLKVVDAEIDTLTDVCKQYVEVLLTVQHFKDPTPKPKLSELELCKQELFLCRQYLSYLLSVQDDMRTALSRMSDIQEQYEHDLEHLQALVGHKTSVPKDQVYPKFDVLTKLYTAAFNESILLGQRCKLVKILQDFKKGNADPRVDARLLRDAINSKVHVPADDAVQLPPAGSGSEPDDRATRLTQESFSEFLQLPVDFQGFCIFTLATQQILVPGNPSLGVVKYQGRHCVFLTEKALVEFCSGPEKYYVFVREACYKHPELIHLLRLHEDFPKSSLLGILQGTAGYVLAGQAECTDGQTQTPMHIVENHIDPNYEWNEWRMRQDALHSADIKQKKTDSTQTVQSSMRRENESQVYLPKEAGTNTTVDSGTNPPRLTNYMTGLRGEVHNQLKVVQLQFDLTSAHAQKSKRG